MYRRLVPIVGALALVAAACATPTAEARVLSYGYDPGTSLTYAVGMDMVMDMSLLGDLGFGVEGPFEIDGDIQLDMEMGYEFAEGPDPDTVALTVTMDITGASGEMTAFGETETLTDGDFADEEIPSFTMILDPSGTVLSIEVDGETLPTDLLSGFGDPLSGLGQSQHFGPAFSDEPVTVGDTWTTTQSASSFGIDVEAVSTHTVTGQSSIGGRDVFVIDTVTETNAVEVDLLELLNDPALNPAAGDPDFGELAGAQMVMALDATTQTSTSWFDPDGGVLVKTEMTIPVVVGISISGVPGQPEPVEMSVSVNMSMTMELVD